MIDYTIRSEREQDYRETENVTREAFWNLYVQGCNEHFLVHIMRGHQDFLPNLDFVAVSEDKIIGNIMYAKSYVINELNNKLDIITFGPISVLPQYQNSGIGSALIKYSKKAAIDNNYKGIIIQGHPRNYCKHGFKCSKDFNISDSDGKYPYSLLALELEEGIFKNHKWKYYSSVLYNINEKEAEDFDKLFPEKKKEYKYTQEEFSIACRAYIE